MPLMIELGKLANEKDLHIQSHISESIREIEAVKSAFKMKYAEVYDAAGLLTNKVSIFFSVKFRYGYLYCTFSVFWLMAFIWKMRNYDC